MLKRAHLFFFILITSSWLNAMQTANSVQRMSQILPNISLRIQQLIPDPNGSVEMITVPIASDMMLRVLTSHEQQSPSTIKKMAVAIGMTLGLPAIIIGLHYLIKIGNCHDCRKLAITFLLLLNYYALYKLIKD